MLTFWQDYPEIQEKLAKVQHLMHERLKISDPEIQAALEKFASRGGKMVRPALFLLFAELLPADKLAVEDGQATALVPASPEALVKIAASLEMLHAATLIHDDIIDDSPIRRGLPSIEAQFGKDVAVYTGDFVYTIYFELLIETMNGTDFLARNAASMRKILQGELTQKQATFDFDNSVEKYLKAINGKTAELLSLACLEGVYFAGGNRRYQQLAAKIGRAIGLAFQIYDDILNFTVGLDEADKPILSDVRQGVFTLPLLIAKENAPEQILPFLQNPAQLSREDCLKLADLVAENGGMAESLLVANALTAKALEAIEQFPDSPSRQILIDSVQRLLQRKY